MDEMVVRAQPKGMNRSPREGGCLLRWHQSAECAHPRILRRAGRHQIVIGKDTRVSGYMLEAALMSGFTAVGMGPTRSTSTPMEQMPDNNAASSM